MATGRVWGLSSSLLRHCLRDVLQAVTPRPFPIFPCSVYHPEEAHVPELGVVGYSREFRLR